MKSTFSLLASALAILTLVGCGTAFGFGGQDRSALARTAVQNYWNDIGHGKVKVAYYLMTSGNRQTVTLTQYGQSMFDFLKGTEGVAATAGNASVNGDQATVPVTLRSPKTTIKLHAYQHLFWEDGGWKISDPNGGLSQIK